MRIEPWSKPRRDELIEQLRNTHTPKNSPLEFQGKVQHYDVHRVPVAMPSYRLSNGRTRAAQREWIVTQGEPDDFFDDPDSAPALQGQHEILRSMARDAGLLGILKSSPQDEPFILDQDGYVVNGNRRLCVMRMLLEEDEQKYERFQHVDVLFLPPCSEDDIRELEGRLQVRPEGKAQYTWVTLAMLYRERRRASWDDKRTASLYEKQPSHVRESIQMLDDAEAYLEDRALVGRYSSVEGMRYAFRELVKTRRKCGSDEGVKALITQIAYSMLDKREEAGDRLYTLIPDIYEHIEAVAEQLRTELPVSPPEEVPDADMELLGGAPDSPYTDLAAAAADPGNRGTVVDVVIDTLEEIRATQRRRKTVRYCASNITQALTALQAAINGWDEETDTAGMPETLAAIEHAVTELRKRLDR